MGVQLPKQQSRLSGETMNQDPWDKYIKWVLLFAALYFLGHIAYALADTVQTPDGQIHTCFWTTIGTYVCI